MDSSGINADRQAADTTLSFGYLLRRLRKARDLTQEDVALRAGCAPNTIYKIEADMRRPSLALAGRLAASLALAGDDRAAFVGAARARLSPARITLPTLPAPPRAPPPPRCTLPPSLTAFVGRERELAALDALLADPATRLITLCGMGGVGKTRLALAAAERQVALAQAGASPFADGVHFAALAGISSAAQLTSALAGALGFALEAGPRSQRRQLLDYLRDRRLLLVLDNYDQVGEDVRLPGEIVAAAPGVTLVVTCRERLLLSGEQLLTLDGLEVPPRDDSLDVARYGAVQLFVRAAQRALPDFAPGPGELAQIAAICRLVEGLPLAIELAAAWVTLLSPAVILAELRQSLALLVTEVRDVPERQRSVRVVCAAVWQRLGPEERAVFARLSCFHGGFTLEAAREVAAASLPILAHLVQRSLLRHSYAQDRFSVHELLRQYAAEQLGRTGDAAALYARHASHYCGLLARYGADLAGPRQLEAVRALGGEEENLHAAWQHAVRAGMAAELGRAADSLGAYYEWQGFLSEGEAAFRAAQAWAARDDSPERIRLRARLTAWAAVFATHQAGPEEAAGLLTQSLALLAEAAARGEDVRAELAFALWRLGRLRALQGHGAALALLEEGLALYRASGRARETGAVLADLGERLFEQGRLAAATNALVEAQLLCEEAGDLRGLAAALEMRSRVCLESGQLPEAEALARRSRDLAVTMGSRSSAAAALGRLGTVLLHTGRHDEARACLEQSRGHYERLGDRPMTAMAHGRLSFVLLHMGAIAGALEHARRSVALGREPEGFFLDQGFLALACAEEAAGDLVAADAAAAEGLQVCRVQGIAATMGALLAERCGLAWDLGDAGRARALVVEALGLAVAQHNVVTLSLALQVCVLPLIAAGRAERAAELYALDASLPLWRASRPVEQYRARLLAALAAALPADVLAAAQTRGRAQEPWAAAMALLAELEGLGWGGGDRVTG